MTIIRSMAYEVKLHPRVIKFLNSLQSSERERCKEALNKLKENPFDARSGADIKKLRGKLHTLYRLRVSD